MILYGYVNVLSYSVVLGAKKNPFLISDTLLKTEQKLTK